MTFARFASLRAVLAVALVGGGVACHKGGEGPDAGELALGTLPPVAAPADLLAEGTVSSPDETLQRIQRGVGGGAALLPSTLGGIASAIAGLDPKLGAEINGASPAFLVVAGSPGAPSWTLAARLVEARRARPLYEGAGAIFDARDAGSGITLLHAKTGRGEPIAVGIAPGGWCVLGSSAAAVADLAPYATRTLSARPVAPASIAVDIPQAALSGSIADAASGAWGRMQHAMLDSDRSLRAEHGGRAPDFGDPRPLVDAIDAWIQKRLGALRDLRTVHLAIDVRDDDLSAILTASPASAAGAGASLMAALHPGDSKPLARLPKATQLALFVRDDAATRAKDTADFEATLAATLGARLGAADAKRVGAALEDWTAARGDWASVALVLPTTVASPAAAGALFGDVASTDSARTSRGVREIVDLFSRVPAIHDPFATLLHTRGIVVTSTDPAAAPALPATVAMLSRDRPPVIGLAWAPRPGDSDVTLALGPDPLPALALLATPLPGETLADDPALRALLDAAGDVAGAIVSHGSPPGRSGCLATGGAVLAWGVEPDAASAPSLRVTFRATDPALHCVAKSLF